MFSKSCEYAIKAMIFVAQKSKNEARVGIKEIAKGTDSPEHFIAKIMQDLSRRKLVHSVKGPNGGFYLDKEDLKASIADIVKAMDGEKLYTDCVLGLKACSEKNPCPVHFEFKEIKRNLIGMIENNTIGDFNKKLDSGKFFLKNQ
ncbi:MAG: Rrf2 family transcriptional regulator [Saprospiraceae bacterium]|jgi:Rrf2 family protein|uniref:Rrf2 family transcriptional regulator n=1 Tax=Candidatus Defluviibacterium haderslevense TaxID=2981993 RepID=A0A9D7XGV5_9BACT|nr:Rrf2 family transcriptional regulator [Candidatus Defluviibacterium haderslevense]MCC7026349.1 Rrf2 family transcriptional regulator [Saprospiraceae bacterium]MBK8242185.1 Rrf2 family transcriptional regulator [Candidatus Defluviibacterium haderslevense]MBK9717222.1 Rrf2 family transcriptional regulator [Candidatus Defluviibacterium haderslevense]MCI1266121.1 Rrf2 family transcriptional regulator [Saprospiraceae bacterium]